MNLRPLVLSVVFAAVAAVASLALADEARAHSVTGLTPHGGQVLHGGVSVGFGVVAPVGPRRRHHHAPYHARRGGYWALREYRVWVPQELIGYDVHGHPVYDPGYWTVETERIWVPGPRRVHHRHRHHRGQGHVAIGIGFRR